MGYESDTVTLLNATVTASGAGQSFGASDWVRGYLYVVFGTVTGTSPTFLPYLQVSPDNGTTWLGASGAGSAGLIANTQVGTGTAVTAIAVTSNLTAIIPVNTGFPGSNIRLAYTVGGTTPSMPVKVYGDFQKWVADNS
jgi:hypothetical protein